jgi:hypothetical protein
MANEKYDSGHPVVVSVVHPEDGVHHIEVPAGTDLADLHSALGDAGYFHPALETAQPTEQGTLEESPDFQAANRRIFDSMNHGKTKGENAAYMYANKPPTVAGEQFNETAGGGRSMHINIPGDAVALSHVHPDLGQAILSPADIKVMHDNKIPVYAVSSKGLFTVDGEGKPFQVFKGTEWMGKDFQGDAANAKALDSSLKSGNYAIKYKQDGKEIVVDTGGQSYPLDQLKQLKSKGINNAIALNPDDIKKFKK